ncbi:Sperm flagellar protein 2 [Hondaea fermentalgiana]|uniref:Sperm flagellar protein 2 n=1 Tax=Hondaea fermentalgiana TaxID=2315210 RepID=A0A2R5GA84_9STRA|nr:Sperm flagellar protein 2 [Hondaea fermentalgiana]|eukprot:GBG27495.1 Sperm flagellar protein 2 [Hondaea fermentalgiana]
MSRLLQDWLNDEVQLTKRVGGASESLGSAFSSGYLLGELLYRHNQQDDFDEFHDSQRVQKKVANFIRIERTLTRLNVKNFDARVALRMINGDDKTCFDVLYKVRKALKQITVEVGRHRDEGFMPGNFIALTNLPAHTRKPSYDNAKSDVFVKTLRQQITSQNQVDMEKHLQPFYDERARQDAYIEFCKQNDRDTLAMYFNEIRRRRMMDKKAELEYLNDWNEKGIGIWTENQRRRKYIDEVRARHESRKIQKQLDAKVMAKEADRQLTIEEISQMEQRVEAHRRDMVIVNGGLGHPDTSNNAQSVGEHRLRRQSSREEQEAREGRRVRFLDQMRLESKNILHERRIEHLQSSLLRSSRAEQALTDALAEQDKFESVIRANRKHREQMDDEQERLEAERFEQRRLEVLADRDLRVEKNAMWFETQITALRDSVRGAAHADAQRTCKRIALDLVDLTLAQIDARRREGTSTGMPETITETKVDFVQNPARLDAEVDDYLEDNRLWAGVDRTSDRCAVGNLLVPLRITSQPAPPAPIPAVSRRFRLQLALLGPPFAHKTAMAIRIAARFGLRILQPEAFMRTFVSKGKVNKLADGSYSDEDYVEACVQAIQRLELDAEAQDIAVQRSSHARAAVGSQPRVSFVTALDRLRQLFDFWDLDGSGDLDAQELLKATMRAHCEGKSQSDIEAEALEAFAQMDFNMDGRITWEEFQSYFECVFGDHTEQVVINLLHHSSGQVHTCQGWVMDGFPFNRAQARLLEARLSGKDVEACEYQPQPALSLPCDAPRPVDPSQFQGLDAGGLDIVLHLKCERAATFRKAAANTLADASERFRVAPQVYITEENLPEVASWYTPFGVFESFETTGCLSDSIFALLETSVERKLQQKLDREASEKAFAERQAHLEKCRRLTTDWLEALDARARPKTPPQAIGNDETAEAVDDDNPSPSLAIADVPPLSVRAFKAAGVLRQDADETAVDLNNPVTYCELLSFADVDTCLDMAAQYREGIEGRARGVVLSFAQLFDVEGIDVDFSQLRELVTSALRDTEAVDMQEETEEETEEDEEEENVPTAKEEVTEAADGDQNSDERQSDSDTLRLEENNRRSRHEELQGGDEATPENSSDPEFAMPDPLATVLDHVRAVAQEQIAAHRAAVLEQEKKAAKGKGKSAAKADKEEEEDATHEEDNSAPPLSLETLDPELARAIVAEVDTCDKAYISGVEDVLLEMRRLRTRWVDHFLKERATVDAKLIDPTSDAERAQEVVSFRESVNCIAEDARYDPRTRAELHARIEDLVAKLWTQSSTRDATLSAFVQELEESLAVPTLTALAEDTYLQLVQLEVSRFQVLHWVLVRLDSALQGNEPGDRPELGCISSIFSGVEDAPAKAGKNAAPEVPRVEKAFAIARAVSPSHLADATNSSPDAEEDDSVPVPREAETDAVDRAVRALRAHFLENLDRIEAKLEEHTKRLAQMALEQRALYRSRIVERFQAEQIAVEALAFYAATQVEACKPLAADTELVGVCFSYDTH